MNYVNLLNPYLVSIAHKKGIKEQFYIETKHFRNDGEDDPLKEKRYTKTKGLIHRYQDRVVITVTNRCFAYCNFCFRKNNWTKFEGFSLKAAEEYLKKNPQIREVLISGGDPLTLSDNELEKILKTLKSISSIKILRIGTRVFSSYPQRVTEKLAKKLSKYTPLWFAIHVNHPDEITEDFKRATRILINEGITMVSQTVLLKGINDSSYILEKLFCKLVELGIKPYYLFGCDQAKSNKIYRVPIDKALKIIESLRFRISGLCVPIFAFDLPDGAGKVSIEPNRVLKREKNVYVFKNFENREVKYEDI